MALLQYEKKVYPKRSMPEGDFMNRYDILMLLIGIIWLWVIIASAAVLKGAYPALEIAILEADGAMACILTLWLKRPSATKKPARAATESPTSPGGEMP